MKRYWCAVMLLPLALAAGCGEKDLIDDSQPSDAQVRALIEQFQSAAASEDDEAACHLMDEEMRDNTEGTNALIEGEHEVLPCGVLAALWNPEEELPSLPGAHVVYVALDRHDQTADVQLDNGTRFFLRRAGGNADGEWRINSMGYRPSPGDWKEQLRLSQPVSKDLIACLTTAGLKARSGGFFSGGTEGVSFSARTIQIGSTPPRTEATAATVATVLTLESDEAARIHGATPESGGYKLRNPFGERVAANAWLRARLDPRDPIDFVRPAPPAPDHIRDKVVDCVE